MALTKGIPIKGFPLSIAQLRRKVSPGDPIFQIIQHQAIKDRVFFHDDFLVDTINLDQYAVAGGAGAGRADFAVNVQQGGVIRATTGTAGDATTTSSLIGPTIWSGDLHAWCEWKIKPVTAVTETKIEVGFTDVVPGSTATVVNSVATPTVNTAVVDAAVYHYRHASTTTTDQLITIGTSITAAKTNMTAPTAVAAGTALVIRIQLVANHAYLWMDGQLLATHNVGGTNYIEGGSAIALWAAVQASNATSKSLDIDYVVAGQDRG